MAKNRLYVSVEYDIVFYEGKKKRNNKPKMGNITKKKSEK